jgi:3-deoxy-D-manno-octulosonate 8-phosphate phosphatase (KDO 8-P phosphatase)
MQFEDIIQYFTDLGGHLITPQDTFHSKLLNTDTFIFDWDGVFNRGEKMDHGGSPFSEPDSMGTNLMRLSYYLKFGTLPKIGIMTGAQNEGAQYLANREHFDFVIRGITDKNLSLQLLFEKFALQPEKVLFVWDDIIDLPVAQWAGTSIQVSRKENPLLNKFAIQHGCVDYVTASRGGEYAIREIANLFVSAMGNASTCIEHRMSYSDTYQKYFTKRNAGKTVQIR